MALIDDPDFSGKPAVVKLPEETAPTSSEIVRFTRLSKHSLAFLQSPRACPKESVVSNMMVNDTVVGWLDPSNPVATMSTT